MKTQMIDRNTTFALYAGVGAVALAVTLFGPMAFAIAAVALLGLSAPILALWRRSATGIAGPEPKETPGSVRS